MGSWGPPDLGVTARRRRAYDHTVRVWGGRLAGLLQDVLPGGRTWHTASLERTRGDETTARGAGSVGSEHSGGRLTGGGSARRSDGKGGRESTEDASRGFFRVPSAWRGSSSWWTGLRGQGTLVTLGSMVWGARRKGQTECEGPRVRGDQSTRWQPTGSPRSFWFESSSP